METNVCFTESSSGKSRECAIITHWMWGSIENQSLLMIRDAFVDSNISVYSFDLFWHGHSQGDIQDMTLSKCYEQAIQIIRRCRDEWYNKIYLYGTSVSSLPILKAWIEEKVNKVLLKSPIIDYYEKRLVDLWKEKMELWKKENSIVLPDKLWMTEWTIMKYDFMADYLEKFEDIFVKNSTIKCFICSGNNDEEVPIEKLEKLVRENTYYKLNILDETHKFSKDWISEFIVNSLNFIKN